MLSCDLAGSWAVGVGGAGSFPERGVCRRTPALLRWRWGQGVAVGERVENVPESGGSICRGRVSV